MDNATPRICVVCGKPIPATRSNQAKTCSEICRIEWTKIKAKKQNEKKSAEYQQTRQELYNANAPKCRVCGEAIPPKSTYSTICQSCLDKVMDFDGSHCIICGKELSTIRLLTHPHVKTCIGNCQNVYQICHYAIHKEQIKRLHPEINQEQVNALNEQKEIELKALKPCHGWIDGNGKKYPCNNKTANYRCNSCWSKMRSSVVDDTDE